MSITRRLRVSHVIVQPVLVWDDGQELSPGPQVDALSVPLSALTSLPAEILREVASAQGSVEQGGGERLPRTLDDQTS